MKPATTLTAAIIQYRLDIARRLGGNPGRILERSGIDSALLGVAGNRLDVHQERAVWRAIVEDTGREDIGLICGRHFPIQVGSLIGYVMMNAPSLRVAGEKMQAYQRLMGDSMGMDFEDQGDNHTLVRVRLWGDWYDELRYTMDNFVGAIFSWNLNNSAEGVRPFRVGFSYQPPPNIGDYEEFFAPAPVEFSCPDSYLLYERQGLDSPVIASNPALFVHFDRQAREAFERFQHQKTYTQKVRAIIVSLLRGEAPSIDSVAGRLAMSSRKLQGLLQEEGSSYQALLNEVRKEIAIQYLKARQASKSEIAYLLGFSDVAVFSRSFKKWTGYSPTEYEERIRPKD